MCYSALVKRNIEHLGRKYGSIVIRSDLDAFHRASAADPKRFPPLADRIFPGHYAPIVAAGEAEREIRIMRYGAYPPPSVGDPKRYTTFNARRDNLTSTFWSGAFMRHHGFVVLEGFYEWVAVSDLLKAGVVTLGDVKAEFERQAAERKARVEAQGKAYKPTPTELKDARTRQIIIEFKPEDGEELVAPVIFSFGKLDDGRWDGGFAIVTDDPPLEVQAAGHDRCPVILQPEVVEDWLSLEGKTAQDFDELLTQKKRVTYRHRLAEAA